MSKQIKIDTLQHLSRQWHAVVDTQGHMTCSCGRPLEKLDENTYRCSYGYPVYSFSTDDIRIDKFGNLYVRIKPHGMGPKQEMNNV